MYTKLLAIIITDIRGAFFIIRRCVKQRDLFTPAIICCNFRVNLEKKGVRIHRERERLNNLKFADNTVIIANSLEEFIEMITELQLEGANTDPVVHISQTKITSKIHIPN